MGGSLQHTMNAPHSAPQKPIVAFEPAGSDFEDPLELE